MTDNELLADVLRRLLAGGGTGSMGYVSVQTGDLGNHRLVVDESVDISREEFEAIERVTQWG